MLRTLAVALALTSVAAAPLPALAQEAPRDLGRVALQQQIDREEAVARHDWKLGRALWLGGLGTIAVVGTVATVASGGLVLVIPAAIGAGAALVGIVKSDDSTARLARVVAARQALADPAGYDPLLVLDTLDGDEAAIAGDNARRDAQTMIDAIAPPAAAPAKTGGNAGFRH